MSADRLRSELLTVLGAHGYTPGPSQRIVHRERRVVIRVGSDGVHVERQGRKLFSTAAGGVLDIAGRILRGVAADPVGDLAVGVELAPRPGKRAASSRIARVHTLDRWPVPLDAFELIEASGKPGPTLTARSIEERFTWTPQELTMTAALPPRADNQPAPPDTDTDTAAADTAAADTAPDDVLPELQDAARVGNYVMIAERDVPAAELAEEVTWHRGWMRDNGVGDPMVAASRRIQAGRDAGAAPRVLEIARWVYAAVQIREEGREGLALAPTIDSAGADVKPTEARKSSKKAKGPKGKRSVEWIQSFNRAVTRWTVPAGLSQEQLGEILAAGSFKGRPTGRNLRVGWCDLMDPLAEMKAAPSLGGDAEFVVWGLRVEQLQTGCPTRTFEIEAQREAEAEAQVKGYALPDPKRTKELLEAKREAWYQTATPRIELFGVVYHRKAGELWLSTRAPKIVDAAGVLVARFGAHGARPERIYGPLASVDGSKLVALSLKAPDLVTAASVDLHRDFGLWLALRQFSGKNHLQVGEHAESLTYTFGDSVDLDRPSAGDDKKAGAKVTGDVKGTAGLRVALADGCQVKGCKLAIEFKGLNFRATFDGATAKSWTLPTECKVGRGLPEEVDAAVDERNRLAVIAREAELALVDAFIAERTDAARWRQVMQTQRGTLLQNVAERWGAAGLLFRHWLPGEQTTLGQAIDAAATQPSRGRKAS